MVRASQYLKNLDWLRAISSILVVALHCNVVSEISTVNNSILAILTRDYLLRLAVPIFMTVSLFLFGSKLRSFIYVTERIKKLLSIAFIWSFIYYLCLKGLLGYIDRVISVLKNSKATPSLIFYYLFTNLETVYFFFISLSILIIIGFSLQNQNSKVVGAFLFGSIILVNLLPIIHLYTSIDLAVFYNPMNFLPYVPLAILIRRHIVDRPSKRNLYGVLALLIGFLLVYFEICFYSQHDLLLLSGYTKGSLVFLAAGIFILSFSIQNTNKNIEFMSSYSLPLYLLHTCLFTLSGTIANIFFVKLLKLRTEHMNLYSFVIVVLLSYLVAKFILPRILSPAIYSSR